MSFPKYPEYKDSGVEWLGEIPSLWPVIPLRGVARPEKNSFIDGDWIESPYITDEGVRLLQTGNIGVGSYKEQGFRYISDESFTALNCTEVDPGDVLICRLADPVGRACQAPDLGVKMITSVDVCIVKVSDYVVSRFLVFFLSSIPYLSFMESQCRGGTRDRVSRSFLGSVRIPLPPLPEQSAIAAFLERETAKIDTLVAEQEKLIELLKEKRQAVISHAVTKGLDPNVPMKNSGVEWLGEVPEHWAITTLGRITLDKCDGPFGSGLKSEHYTDEGVRVIRLQNIRDGLFDGTDAAFIDEAYYLEKLTGHDVVAGDVLVAGLGDDRNSVGRACIAPDDIQPALVKADCFRFRVDPRKAVPAFLAHQLTAGAPVDAGRMSSGSTRSRINLSTMATRKVALPPLPEQHELVEWFDRVLDMLGALIHEAQRAIDLLKERRSALISAAVTGKIDVRGLADATQ